MYRIHLTLPSQSNQHMQHTKELKTNKETKTSSTQEASSYIKHDWYYTPINRIPPITLFWGREKKKSLFLFHLLFHSPDWGAEDTWPNLPSSALFRFEITKNHRSLYKRGISVALRQDYIDWSLLSGPVGAFRSPSQCHETLQLPWNSAQICPKLGSGS